MSFTKLVEILDKDLSAVPSDFLRDAQHIMSLMDAPGPCVECRPLMDEAGGYVMPQWTIHYLFGDQDCKVSFCAPFRYLRNLLRESPDLSFIFAAIMGGAAPAPSKQRLTSRTGIYDSLILRDNIEREKQDAKDISEIV